MLRRWTALILISCFACTNKKYTLTINNIAPNKSPATETHSVYAADDTAAYSQATVMFFLALHAYDRTAEESKPYVTRPVGYSVIDFQGKSVDSILGLKTTEEIKNLKKKIIN